MNIKDIALVAVGEAERQQTDFNGYVRLLQAYQFGYRYHEDAINSNYIHGLAVLIDSTNQYGQYRRTPVTFASGGVSVDWDLIPTAMAQWFDMVNDPADSWLRKNTEVMGDWLVKEFLRIHPFKDGNGRVAWILRTRFYDQWDSPEPLPKYFPGE